MVFLNVLFNLFIQIVIDFVEACYPFPWNPKTWIWPQTSQATSREGDVHWAKQAKLAKSPVLLIMLILFSEATVHLM